MLKQKFDIQQLHRVVLYLRVSDPHQNPRSPDQQEAMIRQRLKSLGLRWVVVKIYRDDGISGRLLRKRLGYQQMLREIKTGVVNVDLILVDTTERFGRVEDLPAILKKLWQHHGVLLLTADTNFADPTTPQGKAYSAFESMRATEEGRVKAHQVVRGKRDLAERGFWPGGPRPFGLQFIAVKSDADENEIKGHSVKPHPEENWILKLAFATAKDTGWGQTRVARFLTDHPEIPSKFKPFHAATVGHWLKNTIYYGHLTWAFSSTDLIDETRVSEPNPPSEVLHVPNFCEPIVAQELWDAVNQLRRKRGEAIRRALDAKRQNGGKQLRAPAPGMVLTHLLTGLVRCADCKRSMRPSSSKYTNVRGDTTSYVSYVCPGYLDGLCENSKRVPEDWLRETVVERLRNRLFPMP